MTETKQGEALRQCASLAAAILAAEEALDPDPDVEIDEQTNDALGVLAEVRFTFQNLVLAIEGDVGAQAFKATKRMLALLDLPRVVDQGEIRVRREATLAGLDQIIALRQRQVDRLFEDWANWHAKEEGEIPAMTVPRDGLSVACRTRSRELEEIVRARDIITGG